MRRGTADKITSMRNKSVDLDKLVGCNMRKRNNAMKMGQGERAKRKMREK